METRSMRRSRLAKLSSTNKDDINAESANTRKSDRKKKEKGTKRQFRSESHKGNNAQYAKIEEDPKEESLELKINQKTKGKEKRQQTSPDHEGCTLGPSPVEDLQTPAKTVNRPESSGTDSSSVEQQKPTKGILNTSDRRGTSLEHQEKNYREINSSSTPKLHAITPVNNTAAIIIAVISVIAVIFIIVWNLGVVSDPMYDIIYLNGLRKLQQDFKNQTERFWKILTSKGLAHLRKTSPQKPLVMLFAAPPSAHNVVDCFTKKLAAIVDPEYDDQLNIIDGKDFIRSSGHVIKEELDDKLHMAFQSGHRAALIHNLDLLPSPSPLLFYSYCDNDNAPYKHIAMLFTVHLPREPDPSLSPVKTEGLVENFLSGEVWAHDSNYDTDVVAALVSRISDTVVVVGVEDEQELKLVCDS